MCGHCLILISDDSLAVEDLIDLGQVIQIKRPVALLFTQVEDYSHNLVEHFKQLDSSFPVMILPEDQSGILGGLFLFFIIKSVGNQLYVSEKAILFCPNISKKPRFSRMITLNTQVQRCPNGTELLSGSDLSVTHIGNMPKIVKGKNQVGSAFNFMGLMSKKYDFHYTSIQAKNIPGAVENVSMYTSAPLCTIYKTKPR